jgi:hypothetical protein
VVDDLAAAGQVLAALCEGRPVVVDDDPLLTSVVDGLRRVDDPVGGGGRHHHGCGGRRPDLHAGTALRRRAPAAHCPRPSGARGRRPDGTGWSPPTRRRWRRSAPCRPGTAGCGWSPVRAARATSSRCTSAGCTGRWRCTSSWSAAPPRPATRARPRRPVGPWCGAAGGRTGRVLGSGCRARRSGPGVHEGALRALSRDGPVRHGAPRQPSPFAFPLRTVPGAGGPCADDATSPCRAVNAPPTPLWTA